MSFPNSLFQKRFLLTYSPSPPLPALGIGRGKRTPAPGEMTGKRGPGTAVGSQPNTPFGVGLTSAESSVTLGYLLNFSGAQFLWKENHIEPTIQRGFLKSVNKRALSTWSFVKSLWVSLDVLKQPDSWLRTVGKVGKPTRISKVPKFLSKIEAILSMWAKSLEFHNKMNKVWKKNSEWRKY